MRVLFCIIFVTFGMACMWVKMEKVKMRGEKREAFNSGTCTNFLTAFHLWYPSPFSLSMGFSCSISGASSVSGFFAAACSLPFDYVKTQIQKMQPDASGKYPYTGSLDCVVKTFKSGGPFKFYTGFPVYCVRIAPHVMVCSISLNHLLTI